VEKGLHAVFPLERPPNTAEVLGSRERRIVRQQTFSAVWWRFEALKEGLRGSVSMDLLDRAFLQQPALPCPLAEPTAIQPGPTAIPTAAADPLPPAAADPLEAIWDGLAESVAASTWPGRNVIAVTAAERAAGASTIAVGLARALDRRGHRMAVLHGSSLQPGYHEDLLELAAGHDLVILDPGPWFGPGRLRRDQLARLSQGCQAVIVVRRDGSAPMPGAAAAMEAVGLACLGEVLTFCSAELVQDAA
jgi:hypothetical protein